LRRAVTGQCRALGCGPEDAVCNLVAALAVMGQNLEHFPFRRYLEMSVEHHAVLRSVIG
jgi:hypothetical protein